MAFFQLVLKARKLEKTRLEYEDEKLRSIEISQGAKPQYTLCQKLRRKKLRCKRKVKGLLDKLTSCPEDTWFHKKAVLLRTDGTFENYILKSVLGFFGGVFLTYIFFMFFVFQLNFTLSSATILCSVLGVILTLGLAFSFKVRCVVFLLLPQFFSKRGRQALMAYAFILAITGPMKNMLHNTSVLSESLACGQEQLKDAVKAVVDLIKQPFYALRDAISKVIKMVKTVVKKIKQTLVAIKRLVLSLLKVIKAVFQWLGSIVNICNKKLGTPFDRCQRVFDGAVADCKAKLGPVFGAICNLAYIVGALCYIVKPLDFICMLVSYVADTIVDAVRKKIKRFSKHMRAMFYVKVKFSHSFHFETNQSKTVEEISKGIVTEIRSRTDKFLTVFDWMSMVTSFFILFMLLRIMHYRHKWLTNERFDNRYLTDDLRTIDTVRARQDKETVLPLNPREKSRYISLSSITLIKVEKTKLAKSAIFLSMATFKLCIYIMADYSLYWVLSTIRYHGRFETKVQQPNSVGVYVSGNGYLADLYRSIIKAFTPSAKESEIDSMPCLPDPIPPDLDRYTQIASLIILCWIMAVFEPYGLRLRHVVMCHYHPERAKQRAAWLYNYIIRSRASFLKFARRQLRRKFGMDNGDKVEKITLADRLRMLCPFLNKLFPEKQNLCLLCGTADLDDQNPHVKCATPGCIGLFCIQCFADLQNLCTICRSPIEYGDLSDMSEEKDSSDDQLMLHKIKLYKPKEKTVGETKVEEDKEEMKDDLQDRKKEEDEVDKFEQTDDKDFEEPEGSDSESSSVYTYQDETPNQLADEEQRAPFKDVEAQKIRDDVTIQIFNDPLVRDVTSSSDEPTPCFVLRAHRRLRAKLKMKSRSSPPREDSSSSTSIANTESWPTEDVEEDEEVIHIEVDGGSRELLLKRQSVTEKKRGRLEKIVAALARIPWLGKGTMGKPPLMSKVITMLQRKESLLPVRTRKHVGPSKGEEGYKYSSSSSSSVSLSSYDDNNESGSLLKVNDDRYYTVCEENIYSKNYDSHRGRSKLAEKYLTICSSKMENTNLQYPHEKEFAVKRMPRHLESLPEETVYFTVDETTDSTGTCRRPREGDDINDLSDVKTCSDSRKSDTWNIIADDETLITCSCASDMSHERNQTKDVRSPRIKRTESGSEITEADSESESNDVSTEDDGSKYVNVTGLSSDSSDRAKSSRGRRRKVRRANERLVAEGEHAEEFPADSSKLLPTTSEKGKDRKKKTLRRSSDYDKLQDLAAKSDEPITELDTSTDKEDSKEEYLPTEVDDKQSSYQEAAESTRKAKRSLLHDPLAGLEIYGLKHEKRKRPVKRETVDKDKQKIEAYGEVEEMKTSKEDGGTDNKTASKEKQGPLRKLAKVIDYLDTKRKSVKRKMKFSEQSPGKDAESSTTQQSEEAETDRKSTQIAYTKHEKGKKRRKKRSFTESDSSTERSPRQSLEEGYDRNKHSQYHGRDSCDVRSRHEDFHPQDAHSRFVSGFRPILQSRPTVSRENDLHGGVGHSRREKNSCSRWYNVDSRERYYDKRGQFDAIPDRDNIGQHEFRDQCTSRRADDRYNSNRYYKEYDKGHDERSLRDTAEPIDAPSFRRREGTSKSPRKYGKGKSRDRDNREPRAGFPAPMIKRYLPLYQKPGLIEELRRHDRVRLIREKETAECQMDEGCSNLSVMCNVSDSRISTKSMSLEEIEEAETLPYQETKAFKDVTSEYRRRAGIDRNNDQSDESEPLILKSQKADRSMRVQQLFPPACRSCKESGVVRRIANRVSNVFKQSKDARKKAETDEQNFERERDYLKEGLPVGQESVTGMYSTACYCASDEGQVNASTSADDTTDNNETSQ